MIQPRRAYAPRREVWTRRKRKPPPRTTLLSFTELRAAQAGITTARNIEVGQVAQSAQAAFTLAVDGPRDAVFHVDEAIFLRRTEHSEIPLTLVSNPAIHAIGHIREVAPVIDPKTGTVLVKVGVDDTPPEMALGSAVIGVGAYEPQRVVRLPWSAATSKDGQLAVWIVDPATKMVALRLVEAEAYEDEALLIGILIRNSVILIIQIEHSRAEGRPPWEAVMEATEHRMRPILLTAAAATLALIPIAREVFWGPMAYAMMGGIVVGTVLTLLFLPALYLAWFRVKASTSIGNEAPAPPPVAGASYP